MSRISQGKLLVVPMDALQSFYKTPKPTLQEIISKPSVEAMRKQRDEVRQYNLAN